MREHLICGPSPLWTVRRSLLLLNGRSEREEEPLHALRYGHQPQESLFECVVLIQSHISQ